WHDKLGDEGLHHLTMLIARLAAYAHHSTLRSRARGRYLLDCADYGERVAGPRGLRPSDLAAASDDSCCQRQPRFDEKFHGDRRGVPAACRQSSEQRCLGSLTIEVKRLRIELRRKRLDLRLIDRMRATRKVLADMEIFEEKTVRS